MPRTAKRTRDSKPAILVDMDRAEMTRITPSDLLFEEWEFEVYGETGIDESCIGYA